MAIILKAEENRDKQTNTAAPAMTAKALRYGSTGDDVKTLQNQLNSLGYKLDVDGSFGPATQAAVKDYQSKNGLAVDGSVGPQTSASLSGNTAAKPSTATTPTAPTVNTPSGGTSGIIDNSGYKTLAERMYKDINATLGAGGVKTDKYGNTILSPTKEAVDAAKEFYDKEVEKTSEWLNANPGVLNPFAPGEFDELYGNIYTTAPNGTQVLVRDLVNVGNGTYTYDEAMKNAAIAQGYTVKETTYAGKPAWYIEGIQKESKPGTSGADEALMSDKAYAVLLYKQQQAAEIDAQYEAALKAGNLEQAKELKAQSDQYHAEVERLRANTWLGGYLGGSDGSMHMPLSHFEGITNSKGSVGGSSSGGSSGNSGGSGSSSGVNNLIPNIIGSTSGVGSSGGSSGGTTTPTVTLPELPNFGSMQTPEFNAMQIPTAPDVQINDYSQYIEEMQKAKNDAALAELEEAYNKNVNSIDRAGVGIDEAYQDARNQTAGAADLANRNFAEMANASGLSSGAGGQAALARSVGMQNNLNVLNMQEAQTLADLQQKRADNDTWYNGAIARAKAEGDAQTAQLLYQEKLRVESETVAAIQQKFANEVSVYQMQMDAAQQQFANEVTKKQLEYQQLRDSVSDAQWQAQFDLAYKQWLQNVEMQQAEMLFQRQQWEKNVEYQQAQLEMQKQSLDAELEQQEWENLFKQTQYDNSLTQQNWQNDFAMQQYQDALAQQQYENYLAALKAESSEETNPVLSWSQLQEALASGNMPPAAIAAFEAYNKVPYADYVKYGSDFGQLTAAYSIPQDIRSMLEQNFPGGYITGDQRWQSWANKYGEDALKAAGFRYGGDVGLHETPTSVRNNAKSLWIDSGRDGSMVANYLNGRVAAGEITQQEAEDIAAEILAGG